MAAPVEEFSPEPPVIEEPALTMAAAASAHSNGSPEPLFDDLDVPAILRRDRRMMQ